jgi:hypothetical protein
MEPVEMFYMVYTMYIPCIHNINDWDRQLPLAVFAINNAASTLGD